MDVFFHIVLLVVLAATVNCSAQRDNYVARAVNDNKTGNYERMLHHIKLVARSDQPLNYTERCLLWTAYNKVVLAKWKKISVTRIGRRYICYDSPHGLFLCPCH